jgi:integrase/recombinase XerD
MQALAAAPTASDPAGLRDTAIIAVIQATGLRASEICGLQVRDVTRDLVFVRRGKGGGQRLVPLTAAAYSAVIAYLAAFPAPPGAPLFRTGPNQPLTRRRLHKALAAYQRALGLPTGVHLLRASFATLALDRDINLRDLQVMLGHQHLGTTALYLGVATRGLVRRYRQRFDVATADGGAQ